MIYLLHLQKRFLLQVVQKLLPCLLHLLVDADH